MGVFSGPKPSSCQVPLDPEIQDPKTYLNEDLLASKETKNNTLHSISGVIEGT